MPNQGGRQYHGAHSNQAGLHSGLSCLQLVGCLRRWRIKSPPNMNANTPAATETLRMVVARLVNSVLILPSIDAETSLQLFMGFECRRARSGSPRS
jgi:hypothetical protein